MTFEPVPFEPLRNSFELGVPQEHAFRTWTERIDQWWPRSHSWTQDPGLQVVLETRLGGRLYERAPDGSEHEWGEVTVWDPHGSFGYLWHLKADRSDASDVVLTFEPVNPARTRVTIVHSGWERLGADGLDWHDTEMGGWLDLLPHYLEAIERESRHGIR